MEGNLRVQIFVKLKKGILDPQGATIKKALENLGYNEVKDVRIGKMVDIEIEDKKEVTRRVDEMCRRLLANPVIEDYSFKILK